MSIPHGAGALYSTTEDLLRWEQGLFGGKLLSAESLQKMITPFKNDYGLGLVINEAEGRKRISHGGGIEGFNTMLAYYPDSKVSTVVLANLNGRAVDQISANLAKLAHGEAVKLTTERKEVPVAPEILAAYVGSYEMRSGVEMVVTLEDGKLITQLGPQPKVPVFAESETSFFAKVVDAQIEFEKNETGAVTALVLHQGPNNIRAPRK
jgi:hypothetical protein